MPIMSAFPISMAKGLKKNMVFNTLTTKTPTKRGNSAVSFMPYPTYAFEFYMDAVRGNEALLTSITETFKGIFALTQGSAGLFLFTDPQDNTVSYANSGMLDVTPGTASPMAATGNGTSTQFQLARSIGGVAWDIVQFVNGSITVKVNGTTTVPASVSSTGVVTFTSAPANAAALTWTGAFYFGACRFDEDTYDATRTFTMNSGTDTWDINSIKFNTEFC